MKIILYKTNYQYYNFYYLLKNATKNRVRGEKKTENRPQLDDLTGYYDVQRYALYSQEPLEARPEGGDGGGKSVGCFGLVEECAGGGEVFLTQLIDSIGTVQGVEGLAVVEHQRGVEMREVVVDALCHLLMRVVER